MSGLIFEATSNAGYGDVYVYSGTGSPTDITASVDAELNSEGGGGGIVGLYGDDPSQDDGGSDLFGYNGSVYFNGWDNGQQVLYVYNQSTAKLSAMEPAHSWGSGINPDDFVDYNNSVYFVGEKANGYQELCVTNGTASGTKSVSNSWVDNGQMATFNGLLFFDGQSLTQTSQGYETGNEDLVSYNSTTGVFKDISAQASNVSANGFDPQDMVSAFSDSLFESPETYLFMAGTDAGGHQNLYAYTGSSLIQIKGGAASGLDPLDITAGQTNIPIGSVDLDVAGVYFSGVDTHGERGLFFANGQTGLSIGAPASNAATEVVASSFGGSSDGLDPYDITELNGNIYFTGNDNKTSGETGRGLFEYDRTTNKTTELISSNTLNFAAPYDPSWGDASPVTMAVHGSELYFVASNPNASGAASVPQLYAYSGSGAAPTHFITGASLNGTPGPMVLGSF